MISLKTVIVWTSLWLAVPLLAMEAGGQGQAQPEPVAEIFAPGVISLPGHIEFCLALSPDGNEAFFAIRKGPGQTLENIFRRL